VDEIAPILLGAVIGISFWRNTRGFVRLGLSIAAVIIMGASATIISGEYLYSWLYLLLDFGEAAIGLAIGFAIARFLLPGGRLQARRRRGY